MGSAAIPKGDLVKELPVGKDPNALAIRGDPEGMVVGTGEDRIVEQPNGPKVRNAFAHVQRGDGLDGLSGRQDPPSVVAAGEEQVRPTEGEMPRQGGIDTQVNKPHDKFGVTMFPELVQLLPLDRQRLVGVVNVVEKRLLKIRFQGGWNGVKPGSVP